MVWLRAVRLAVTFFIYTIHLTRPPLKNTHKNKKRRRFENQRHLYFEFIRKPSVQRKSTERLKLEIRGY